MSIASRYKKLVQSVGNRLTTISDIQNCGKTGIFADTDALMAIIRYVQTEAQGISRTPKKTVTLFDPTADSDGLKVAITEKEGIYYPGDLVHIRLLRREERARSVAYTAADYDVTVVTAFATDYDSDDCEDETPLFRNRKYRSLCRVLEKWQASQLLKSPLKSLRVPDQELKSYCDLVVQVVRKRLMLQSVVLTVWDATIPCIQTTDPYQINHRAEHPTDGWTEQIREQVLDVSQGFGMDVNVWSNDEKSRTVCFHFETCVNHCHLDQDELLVLYNVELKRTIGDVHSLTLHSGHHKGKAARIVRPKSVLGQMFREKMSQSLSEILSSELSVVIPVRTGPSLRKKRRTTIEVASERMPRSITRIKELISKMPLETHIAAIFEHSIDRLQTLRDELLQMVDGDDASDSLFPELPHLPVPEYAELLTLVIQIKGLII